jgi:predicted transcriptional regulator
MKPFCEVVVSRILPAVRAAVAAKLVNDYGFSQTLAAKKMGVSQPAVSQYTRSLRGANTKALEDHPRLARMASDMAARIASGRDGGFSPTMMFCELCRSVRLSGLGCDVHRSADGSLAGCGVCMENAAFYGGAAKKATKAPVRPLNRFAKK